MSIERTCQSYSDIALCCSLQERVAILCNMYRHCRKGGVLIQCADLI